MNYEQKHPVTCPFCRRVIHIDTQGEDENNFITVTCEIHDDGLWGPGCGHSFRSYNFFKIRTGAVETFDADNPPPTGEKEKK